MPGFSVFQKLITFNNKKEAKMFCKILRKNKVRYCMRGRGTRKRVRWDLNWDNAERFAIYVNIFSKAR